MGKKRRNPQQQQNKRPQQSFEQMVSNLSSAKVAERLKPYVDQQVRAVGKVIAQQQKDFLEQLYIRLTILEEYLIERFDDLTQEGIAELIAIKEDTIVGLEQADVVEKGDRVRFELSTRMNDQEDFQDSSKLMVDDVGSGATLGKEIEEALIGLKINEEKEFQFGKEKGFTGKVLVNRISRKPELENPVPEESKTENQTLEESDANTDEG